jgi:hypothetical protein
VTVSLLGLGPMGAPMAANLVRGLGALTVWNRTPEKAGALVGMGAGLASRPPRPRPMSCRMVAGGDGDLDHSGLLRTVRPMS